MIRFFDFDGAGIATLPAGFTNTSSFGGSTGNYQVQADGNVSAPHSLLDQGATSQGRSVMLTGPAASADVAIQFDQRVNLDGSQQGGNAGAILRASADGQSGYGFALDFHGQQVYFLAFNGGGTVAVISGPTALPPLSIVDGAFVTLKAEVQGSAPGNLRFKIWQAGSAEPAAWWATASDATYSAAGYAGILSGESNVGVGSVPASVDNLYVGPAGSTFSGGFVAPVLSAGTVGPTSVQLAWTSAGQSPGSPTYQLMRSPRGANTFADVPGATTSPATDATASASTAYDYKVRASDGINGPVDSNAIAVTTPAVAAPAAASAWYSANFESATAGALAGWSGSASPSGAIGSFAVSSTAPIFGLKSFAQANALDSMVMSYRGPSGSPLAPFGDADLVFLQRVRVGPGGSATMAAAPMLAVDPSGVNGYALVPVPGPGDIFDLYLAPGYSVIQGSNLSASPGVGRQAVDGDLLWTRFRRSGSSLRGRAWLDGSAEPSTWQIDATDSTYPTGTFGLRPSGSLAGATLAVDDLAVGGLALTAGTPYADAVGNTSIRLRWAPATGGTAPYSYQLKASPRGAGTFSNVGGPTGLLTATASGLTPGSGYDFELVVSDAASGSSTSAVASATATVGGPASAFTLAGPSTGPVGAASAPFTVTPDGPYTGTITITPSGGGLSTPVVLTFAGSAAPQTFTLTATSAGAVTLAPSSGAGLAGPAPTTYTASVVVSVLPFVSGSGTSIGLLFEEAGRPASLATVNPTGPQPTYSVNGGPAVALPPGVWGVGRPASGPVVPYSPFYLAPLPRSSPAVLRLGCGEGQFSFGNAQGGNSWAAGGTVPASYSGRPYTSTTAGDLVTWKVEGLFPGTFQLSARWPTDASLATNARFVVIDGTGATLATYAADQSAAPADFTEAGFPWKVLGSVAVKAPNSTLYLRLINPGGKVAIDAVRLARTSPDNSVTIRPTDSVTVTIPDGWAGVGTLASNAVAVPGATLAASNYSGGSILPAPPPSASMGAGFNVEPDGSSQSVVSSTNLMGRVALPLDGAVASDPVTYLPLAINAPTLHGITVATPPTDSGGKGKGLSYLPNGYYGLSWDGASDLALEGGVNTDCGEVASYRSITGSAGNYKVFNLQARGQVQFSPAINLAISASGPISGGSYPAGLSNVRITPPDPADPTGLTPWANPPADHPNFTAMMAGSKSLRFLDPLGSNSQYIHEFVDITNRTTVSVGVARIEAPGVADPFFDPIHWCVAKVTTSGPHGLFDGCVVRLNNCGTATLTNGGPPVDLAGLPFYGQALAHVVSPTVVYLQIANGGGGGYTMSNVLTPASGTLTATWGGGLPFARYIDRCNAVGADFYLNMPTCSSDDCIARMASTMAGRLANGLKVRLEYSNEAWNYGFFNYYWINTLAYRYALAAGRPSPNDLNYIPGYVDAARHRHAVFLAAWVAAGRSASDVVRVIASAGGNPGAYTITIAAELAAQGVPCEEFATAPYVDNFAVANGTEPTLSAITDVMTGDQSIDLLELEVLHGGWGSQFFDAHRAYLDQYPALRPIRLISYEGGWDFLTPLVSDANGRARSQAIITNPRMFNCTLGLLKHFQDHGCTLFHFYYLSGGSAFSSGNLSAAWSVYNAWDQQPGTGSAALDPINVSDPDAVDRVKSEVGGAIKLWNSLVPAAPSTPATPRPSIPGRNGAIGTTGYPRGMFRPTR
jgi:hypothetical protein